MLTSQRKQHLLAVLKRDGQLVAKTLSQSLGLSEDTIRRDLRELAQEGLLQRVHGGALPASPAVANYTARQQLAPSAKRAIGRAAAALIQSGQIILLDGGTTAVQVARQLAPDLKATIVTHSPSVAVELANHLTVEVILIGGRLFKHSVVTVGASAVEALSHIRADIYFIGVTGVHVTQGLSTGDLEEAYIKRALIRQAAETIVLASVEKLGVASAYIIAPISGATGMIVESSTPPEIMAPFQELNLSITYA
ncbi:DeoR/GlpR family DNA-binding transcription regulator [Deinococcus sp.]|uniref:DeoR/GlpR family DNA-binding transcription regulator n=1 Tax=Deinococcus sp. TaxID=47478 RepID=UPI0025E1E5FB|nr:DeoR/GlpR family DNA-binding transcription regulator [Deinococcus sp.]